MKKLLLTSEESQKLLNEPIFVSWLSGEVDESQLTEEQKITIASNQVLIDYLIPDEELVKIVSLIPCKDQYKLLTDYTSRVTACCLLGIDEVTLAKKIALVNLRRMQKEETESMQPKMTPNNK